MALTDVTALALEEIQQRSRKKIYLTDPEAWLWDVMKRRWWSKQAEIAQAVVGTGDGQTFTLVKSANGVGKTQLGSDLMTWAVAVHDPLEVTVLATANVFSQISQNAFRYITDNYSIALQNGHQLPGRIVSDPAVRFDRGFGLMPKDIIIGRRPADKNLLSSFQGTHDKFVCVLLDEAGGLPEDLWIGAYAVTTNEHVAVLAIGNPDELNTPFYRRFTNEERYSDWNRFTISHFDTPNFTGEVIYPDDPVRDAAVKSLLPQPETALRFEREAHPNVYRAKVLGEFPDSSDTSFFVQSAIEKAYNTEITPDEDEPKILGVDVSFAGEDKTTFYLNQGGRIRKVHEYNKLDDYMEHARRIDEQARKLGVDRVQIDASGTGAGVFSNMESMFRDAPYLLVGLMGARSSSDTARWANARGEHYDTFREAMQKGEIDLDPDDAELRDQMYTQTVKTTPRGQIHPTPKAELRASGLASPDHLDGAIYSFFTPEELKTTFRKGDMFQVDSDEFYSADFYDYIRGAGMPIL